MLTEPLSSLSKPTQARFFCVCKGTKNQEINKCFVVFFSFFTQKVLVVSKKVVSLQSDLRGEVKREEDRMVR